MEKINIQQKQRLRDCSLTKPWANADNADFYKKMPISFFIEVAIQGGLDDGCDVLAIGQYIKNAKSILEVGAGYGRVIDSILKQGFCGQLTAIERNPVLCQYLQNNFGNQTEIICNDLLKATFTGKYDLILWMWTGICEFSKTEQCLVINILSECLNKNGLLVIDTVPPECPTQNSLDYDKHNRVIATSYGNNYCYLPDSFDIAWYANSNRLKLSEKITYKTKTNKTNYLYLLQKNN